MGFFKKPKIQAVSVQKAQLIDQKNANQQKIVEHDINLKALFLRNENIKTQINILHNDMTANDFQTAKIKSEKQWIVQNLEVLEKKIARL